MKIEINTSVPNATSAHYILNVAIHELKNNPDKMKDLMVSKTDVDNAERFLKASTSALVKSISK